MKKFLAIVLLLAGFSPARADNTTLLNLTATLQAACAQVVGASIGDINNKATWTIFYAPGTTCQAAAQAAMASFNPNAVPVGQQYGQLVAAGLNVTSTGTSATSGVYAIAGTFADGSDIVSSATAIYLSLKVGDPLPGNGSTFNWSDIQGAPHPFTAAQFQAFFLALKSYRYALSQQATQPTPSWPSPNVTIP